MKILSNRERNRRKLYKIYNSIENKLHDNNLLWWQSLTMKARYSFVFDWINMKRINPKIKFKHFLKSEMYRYTPHINNKRGAVIDYLLK